MTTILSRAGHAGASLAAATVALALTTAAAAAPVMVGYDDIVQATLETFEGFLPLDFPSPDGDFTIVGASGAFNGFTAHVDEDEFDPDEDVGLLLLRPTTIPCNAAVDTCLASFSEDELSIVFDDFAAGTRFLGFRLFPLGPDEIFEIDVEGQNESEFFEISGAGFFGFGDADGLVSVTITRVDGLEDWAVDDVITGTALLPPDTGPQEVPAPAALSLLCLGLAGLGAARRRTCPPAR